MKISEFDVIYLSYDEPNAEQNYADLLNKVPWAKRVHGVKGSDAAHKACAEISETDRFITVDGDNIIDEKFIDQEIQVSDHIDLDSTVISWCGKNVINNLMYGNGGLKCWPKDYVRKMRTHENADPLNIHAQVEFCWDTQYKQMSECFSTTYNNTTPQQAWRAGFREGVKLALDRGIRVEADELLHGHKKNLNMLYVWLMVGADVKNGSWAIYGAREGLYKTMCTDWDYVNVRDFDYLNSLWKQEYSQIQVDDLYNEIVRLGESLKSDLKIPIATNPLDAEQSKFFKEVYDQPTRTTK